MSVASNVLIANLALVRLGAAQISSLTEGSEEANKVNLVFERCRRQVFRHMRPLFAQKSAALTLLAVTPPDYHFAYQRPNDLIAALRIVRAGAPADDTVLFQVSGNEIHTNEEAATLRYVYDETDPTRYDDTFIDALALKIASDLSLSLNGDPNVQRTLIQMYRAAASVTMAADGREDRRVKARRTTYLDARR